MAGSSDLSEYVSGDVKTPTDAAIIDVDVHITYNAEVRKQVARYMDKPYQTYVDPDTSPDSYPSHGWPKSLGGARRFNLMDVTTPADIRDPLCSEFGVDHPIINVLSPVDKLLKHDRAIEETRAINDFLLDGFLDDNPDFYGLATIAGRDPDAAVAEIDRIADESQIVGAFFAIGEEFNRPFGDPRYDRMYQALEANSLVPVYHITGIHRNAPILRQFQKVAEWHATGPSWAAQATLTSLVLEGVPEKFPDLDFVILEGGLGWVPGMMARLNREHGQWRNELPLLTQSPEEYIRDRFYFGTQPLPEFNDPAHFQTLLTMIGPESLLFCTDHPHYDFDHPGTLDRFLRSFDDADRTRVLSGNARDVFGLA